MNRPVILNNLIIPTNKYACEKLKYVTTLRQRLVFLSEGSPRCIVALFYFEICDYQNW